jgi:hypothetical protein
MWFKKLEAEMQEKMSEYQELGRRIILKWVLEKYGGVV